MPEPFLLTTVSCLRPWGLYIISNKLFFITVKILIIKIYLVVTHLVLVLFSIVLLTGGIQLLFPLLLGIPLLLRLLVDDLREFLEDLIKQVVGLLVYALEVTIELTFLGVGGLPAVLVWKT